MSVQAVVPARPASAPALTVAAMRAARVMMRKSSETQPTYQGIYERGLTFTRARLNPSAHQRCSRQAAARDLALIQTRGGAGLRSQEARTLPSDPF